MDKGFLTVNEVSEYLSVKPSTLYLMVESGELPHYRIGRLIRFKKDDVNQWMEAHRREGINVDKKARDILKAINRPGMDIDRIVEKSIAEVKGLKYTPNHGRPGQSRSLRKEVSDGAL
jgi:excisionase family DNA binding protein